MTYSDYFKFPPYDPTGTKLRLPPATAVKWNSLSSRLPAPLAWPHPLRRHWSKASTNRRTVVPLSGGSLAGSPPWRLRATAGCVVIVVSYCSIKKNVKNMFHILKLFSSVFLYEGIHKGKDYYYFFADFLKHFFLL